MNTRDDDIVDDHGQAMKKNRLAMGRLEWFVIALISAMAFPMAAEATARCTGGTIGAHSLHAVEGRYLLRLTGALWFCAWTAAMTSQQGWRLRATQIFLWAALSASGILIFWESAYPRMIPPPGCGSPQMPSASYPYIILGSMAWSVGCHFFSGYLMRSSMHMRELRRWYVGSVILLAMTVCFLLYMPAVYERLAMRRPTMMDLLLGREVPITNRWGTVD